MTTAASFRRPPSPAAPLFALLAAVRRRARWLAAVESCSWLALAAVAAFWATLACDRALEPPAWARAAALVATAAGLGWILRQLVARLAAPLPDATLALAVERTHPRFGDSLSTAVGLADPAASAVPVDPDLAARTTAAAVALAGSVRSAALFRRRRIATVAAAAAVALGSVAALAAVRPAVVGHWSRRLLALDPAPWPRRVSLVAEGFASGTRIVARGSDVVLLVRARSKAALPDFVEVRSRPVGGAGPWRVARMGGRGAATDGAATFEHLLAGVATDYDLEIRGGDARLAGLVLRAVEPPAVERLEIAYEPPAYLGTGWRSTPPTRTVRVPRGARLRLRATATKPLAEGSIVALAPAGERTLATLAESPPAEPGRTLSAELEPLDADLALAIRLRDTVGVAAREPVRLEIAVVPDEPPAVALRLCGISTAVTPRATLVLEGTLADDHGLAAAAVTIARTGTAAAPPVRVPIERVRGGETLIEIDAPSAVAVPLEPLGLAAGCRLTVQVEARDGCGLATGPNVGTGDAWTLDVVTPEALQAMLEARETLLRRRFETVLADLAQARERLATATAPEPADCRRLGDAAARAAGETADIAAAFRLVQLEFANNRLLTPEIDARLIGQIAEPLAAVAAGELADLERRGRAAGAADAPALVAAADRALERLRAVLDRMLELESFNEVLERLRGVIGAQEELRRETLERQKRRGREALGSP